MGNPYLILISSTSPHTPWGLGPWNSPFSPPVVSDIILSQCPAQGDTYSITVSCWPNKQVLQTYCLQALGEQRRGSWFPGEEGLQERRVSYNRNNFSLLSWGAEVGVQEQQILARMPERWWGLVVRKLGKAASGLGTPGERCVCVSVSAQSCLILCNPMDYSLPGSSVHGNFHSRKLSLPDKNTGVGCHLLLQGLFPSQGSNPGLFRLLHWQVGSLPTAPPGKPLVRVYFGLSGA